MHDQTIDVGLVMQRLAQFAALGLDLGPGGVCGDA